MGELRSLAAPARPLRLGGMPSQSPFEGGLSGNEMLAFFLQHFPAAGLVHSPSILPAAVEKETQRPAVQLCEADQPFSGL